MAWAHYSLGNPHLQRCECNGWIIYASVQPPFEWFVANSEHVSGRPDELIGGQGISFADAKRLAERWARSHERAR